MTTIDEKLGALTSFMPLDKLRSRIATVTAWIGREPDALIPSTSIGADGINLSTIVLVAGDLIAEVNLGSLHDSFDVMKLAVYNFRLSLGVQEVKSGEVVVGKYHTAQVTLHHTPNPAFATVLTYAGVDEPHQWLASIKAAFPPAALATA